MFVIVSQVDLNLNQKIAQHLDIREGIFIVCKQFPDADEFFKSKKYSLNLTKGFKNKILSRQLWQTGVQYFFPTEEKVLRVARLPL